MVPHRRPRLDRRGRLSHLLLGNRKEFISRGGEKISLYEIERALLLHASIRDAAAFSVPHPRLGENVAAAVVLMPGATTTPTDIKAFLADHLAPFKIPQHVVVMTKLPKGATPEKVATPVVGSVGRSRPRRCYSGNAASLSDPGDLAKIARPRRHRDRRGFLRSRRRLAIGRSNGVRSRGHHAPANTALGSQIGSHGSRTCRCRPARHAREI